MPRRLELWLDRVELCPGVRVQAVSLGEHAHGSSALLQEILICLVHLLQLGLVACEAVRFLRHRQRRVFSHNGLKHGIFPAHFACKLFY